MTMSACTKIHSVGIVDDNQAAREAYTFSIEDANLKPITEDGPIPQDSSSFLKQRKWDALLCDHHLMNMNYSSINGAKLVADAYRKSIPSILITRYQDAFDQISPYREFIPVLINPDNFCSDNLLADYQICLDEFSGRFRDSRRTWRTLIRIEDVDEQPRGNQIHMVVTGWSVTKVITLKEWDLPKTIQNTLTKGKRLHAMVNIGAERREDLYFKDWEND